MIIVKLIVIFCSVNGLSATPTDFCEICLNHTLCKYKTQGPSPSCTSYDSSALLTSQDITELVNRINERRNFVAMGYSKILPQAANMKKIHWSTELSTFAQRWADQCDPSIRPDKEDQCRDLENVKVGQNIGSVLGPSPGLSVKGFVEMWFIQVLDYDGSVTYYNKSRDFKTSYLTQLIWANTEFVGCGKAKFYVDERNVMLERLVCNFAPKGNAHGKPVYSIGYPGTQCKNKMVPDVKYKGLCSYEDDAIYTKLTTQGHPVYSLLRILNLSNDSVKHEIDPIHSNLKQINSNSNSSNEQRNQKTRHIISKKTYTAVKRIPQLRKQMMGNNFMNISGNYNDYHYQHDRGHSHLYHGHEPPQYNYETTTVINNNQDYRKYDYTTQPMNSYYANTNYRRFNQYAQCTRRMKPIQDNCASNQCTRAPDACCQQTTMCPLTCTEISCTQPVEDHTCLTPYIPPLPDPCACTQQTCPPTSTNCNYNTNCPCSLPCSTNTCCVTSICPGIRRQNNDINDYRRAGSVQYYDMIPNVVVRSGNHKLPLENSSKKGMSFVINYENNKSYKTMYEEEDSDEIHKGVTDYSKYKSQGIDYIYRSFDSGLRKKRQLEDQISVKPFWQIEHFNYQKPSQLKSMRFTTLPNRKNRKTRKNMNSGKLLTSTEPITLKLVDYPDYQPEHVTEKYLSFDELMHLRKINDGFAQYDFRRKDKTTAKATTKAKATTAKGAATTAKGATAKTTKAATKAGNSTQKATQKAGNTTQKAGNSTTAKATTEKATTAKTTKTTSVYTLSTPFQRLKHCTRLLTCTWTFYTGNEGNEDGDNQKFAGKDIGGSRTRPGYVEGCTRTSTCTRDYMERNKMYSQKNKNSSDSTPGDEDYCERRSLNVQRRNSDTKKRTALIHRFLDYTNVAIITTEIDSDPFLNSYNIESVTESVSKSHDCICNEQYARKKREETECFRDNEDKCENSRSFFSYGDLYYLVLNKILKSSQANKFYDNQCPCNSSISSSPVMVLFLLIYLNTFYL